MSSSPTSSDKQRDCLVLIVEHLQSAGYHDVVSLLKQQAPALERWSCADNIDLQHVIAEFEVVYETMYGRKPIIGRRAIKENDIAGSTTTSSAAKGANSRKKQAAAARRRASMEYRPDGGKPSGAEQHSAVLKHVQNQLQGITGSTVRSGVEQTHTEKSNVSHNRELEGQIGDDNMICSNGIITGRALTAINQDQDDAAMRLEDRLLKPIPTFGGDLELQSLARSIQRDIIQSDTGVRWDDIVDLAEPKRLLQEAVVTPLLYPSLFTGLLSPWCGVLLFGPPGTGKTLLAKAVAAQSNTTFFNISASSIVSKFRGDSEKLVRVLFDLARHHSPSVIFLDEIDSIMGSRSMGSSGGDGGGACSEHEGSRRMKTELLIQMDGLSRGNEHVFVLAASNLPWQLDAAMLRRLDKRVLVPLPNKLARRDMLKAHFGTLSAHSCKDVDFDACADGTEGYSGADLRILAKEAAMRAVRRILKQIEGTSTTTTSRSGRARAPISDEDVVFLTKRNPVTADDLQASLRSTNKSYGSKFCERYEEWAKEYGST